MIQLKLNNIIVIHIFKATWYIEDGNKKAMKENNNNNNDNWIRTIPIETLHSFIHLLDHTQIHEL